MSPQPEEARVPPLPTAHTTIQLKEMETQTDLMEWSEDEDQTEGHNPQAPPEWSSTSSTESGSGDTQTEDVDDGCESVIEKLSRGVSRLLRPHRIDRSTQTLKDPMVWETQKLAFDIIFYTTGKRSNKPSGDVMRCLRNSVAKMLDNHHIVFNGMMSRLKVNRDCDIERGFTTLAEELFTATVGDNSTSGIPSSSGPYPNGPAAIPSGVSWGKVIALYAFGARLALHCTAKGLDDMVLDIASSLAHFAVRKLTPFLRAHGGWATLCDAFPQQNDYEAKVWTSLLVTGVGLTTVAAFVALMR